MQVEHTVSLVHRYALRVLREVTQELKHHLAACAQPELSRHPLEGLFAMIALLVNLVFRDNHHVPPVLLEVSLLLGHRFVPYARQEPSLELRDKLPALRALRGREV